MFRREVADVEPFVNEVLKTKHGENHSLIYQIYEAEEGAEPTGLDAESEAAYAAAYEAARDRVLAARQVQQDKIKPAYR